MIYSPNWLLFAYVFNVLVLVPTCYNMLVGGGVPLVFEGHVAESAGLRLLVGCLWLSILLGSAAGLRWPAFFAPIVLLQVVYKLAWLLIFILPLMRAGKPFPIGISVVFGIIVVTYPLLLWASTRQPTQR